MSKVFLMIKEFGSNQRNSNIIRIGATVFTAFLIIMTIFSISYSKDISNGIADNLIRLHVVANSDSVEDQSLKRDVRDVVLAHMKEQLKDSKDLEQTRYIIDSNMSKIEELAKNEITRQGKNYPVQAMLGSYPFPTKSYGDVVLPAGNYQALRVVIGKGQGSNWWCVLFPPLCFVDATHGTIPDHVKENLKNTLTAEEYSIITSVDSDEDIPIKVRFKVVDFFQSSRIRFTGMISRLFKPAE